ncbi:hypothetical protein GGR54DRAFT_399832 [Hypoxylon sp. NC1633]|nr:hypothetical protein GGR54DRAFT_399832 [Hypoxylon sp. NC1633]
MKINGRNVARPTQEELSQQRLLWLQRRQQKRKALEDARNRANQPPTQTIKQEPSLGSEPRQSTGNQKECLERIGLACDKENEREDRAGTSIPKAWFPYASSGKKRKAEMSLEEEIAAYKEDLGDCLYRDTYIDTLPNCDVVRSNINKLLDAGFMTKEEFSQAIKLPHINWLDSFLSYTGKNVGILNDAYYHAGVWFKQRELAGLEIPDVKRRRAEAADDYTSDTFNPDPYLCWRWQHIDISDIYLEGEETDSVSIMDTYSEVQRKVRNHVRMPGITEAQFCRDLYAQLNATKRKGIRSHQVADFLFSQNPTTSANCMVYYAAYVYFEKLRIAQDQPMTKDREHFERNLSME